MTRILIVDDAPVCLLLLSKLLAGEGYEVATAKNGAEALKILEEDIGFDPQQVRLRRSEAQGKTLFQQLPAPEGIPIQKTLAGQIESRAAEPAGIGSAPAEGKFRVWAGNLLRQVQAAGRLG